MEDKDVVSPVSLYAELGEVVAAPASRARTQKTQTIETTDEGRLTIDELLGGQK
jgi:hypothetical protein